MFNPLLFANVPPLIVVIFTIMILTMSVMAFIFQCFRVYYAMKELKEYND